MNNKSRIANMKANVLIGIILQCTVTIMAFVSRTLFIKILGAEYLGVNGLYTNILSLLSMAELGIGNVLIFSLYKPIVNNDTTEIITLLNFYKKIYRLIALGILLLGVVLIPFLNLIVNSELEYSKLVIYYLIHLITSVSSYFITYKTTLINADQKIYIIKIVNTSTLLLQHIIQLTLLYFFHNYTLYLLIKLFCALLNNIILNHITNKTYPFLKKKVFYSIDKQKRKSLFQNIKSMFIYKLSSIVVNNTDNILVSIICGTIYVGYYSNYSMIITTITTFSAILINSIIPSLGNLNAEENIDKSYDTLKTMIFFFSVLTTFISACFLVLFNDFIKLWIGSNFLLGNIIVLSIVTDYYFSNIINPIWMYRETMGLFSKVKHVMLCTAIINIILSVFLGIYIGMAGVFFATALSRICTVFWYEPLLLYKEIYKKSVWLYWKMQITYILFSISNITVIIFICGKIPGSSILLMIIKILLCGLILVLSYTLFFFKTKEYQTLFQYFRKIFMRRKS